MASVRAYTPASRRGRPRREVAPVVIARRLNRPGIRRVLLAAAASLLAYAGLAGLGLFRHSGTENRPAPRSLNPPAISEAQRPADSVDPIAGPQGYEVVSDDQPDLAAPSPAGVNEPGQAGAAHQQRMRPVPKSTPSVKYDRPEASQAAAPTPPASAASAPAASPPGADKPTDAGEQTVTVVGRVENGRLVEARVLNPRPGMGALESAALRVVRQRRYANTESGAVTESVKIKRQ